MTEEVTEQAETTTEQAPPDAELSLSEHEAQFAAGDKRTAFVPDDGTVGKERDAGGEPVSEEPARVESTAAQQARDKETGQFKPGKKRGKDAVKRIDELTGRAKTAEERLAAAEAELARLRTSSPLPSTSGNGHPPAAAPTPQPAQPKAGERYILPAPPFDPEPQENDPKYAGDTFAYLREISRWESRQAVRQSEFDRMVADGERQQQESQQAELRTFAERVDAAKARHEDFEEVAFERQTPIQKGSITDTFILRDDNGPEMLYYLHAHPKELDDLLKMPELGQVKFLTLLSQRLSSNGNGSTGAVTTSVPAARTIVLPPKPPNVVRTEAQRASGGPSMDRELSILDHESAYRPKKVR